VAAPHDRSFAGVDAFLFGGQQPFDDLLDPRLPDDEEWPEDVPFENFGCPAVFRSLLTELIDRYSFLFQALGDDAPRSQCELFDRVMALTRSYAPEELEFRTLDPESFDWVVAWLELDHGAGSDQAEIRILVACCVFR